MKKTLFDELLKSVQEGGAILHGERKAAWTFSFEESSPGVSAADRLARECAKLQRPAEQAAAEEVFPGEAEWPEY